LNERNKNGRTGHDRFEREHISFHQKVRKGYLKLARMWPRRFRIIDADRRIEAVDMSIWEVVVKKLGRMKKRKRC
jgi:dTMP kinase